MSVEKLIIDNMNIWTSSLKTKSVSGRGNGKKLELYGINKLRKLILELAVRGKLISQDPNDEPASVLLECIAEEKSRLVKEKQIKKQKKLPNINEEMPFSIPKGWSPSRLGELGLWATGNGFPKKNQGNEGLDVLFCKVSDMNLVGNEKYIDSTFNTVSIDTANDLKLNLHPQGTVIFPKIGGAIATNKRRIITKPTAIDNNCLGITPLSDFSVEYLYLVLSSIDLTKYQAGTSVPALSQGTLELLITIVPPKLEQHRIVSKVNELMTLCDELEQQTTSSIDAHETLVEVLLTALTNSTNADEFALNWASIGEHFDTLFITERCIDQLQKTILQLAVMGKLVNFGSFEIKTVKELLCFGPRNGFSPKEAPTPTDYKVLKLGATSYGYLNIGQSKFVDIEVELESHLWLKKDDILVQRGNSATFVGSNVIVDKDYSGYIYPDLMMKLRTNDLVAPEYLSLVLSAPNSRESMWSQMTGTSGTMPKISKKVVEGLSIPVPANKEVQLEIVKEVNRMFLIIDNLKLKINQCQMTQIDLTDAIVAKLL
ncbi:restriction endonuclease subunit S [Vibrio splendidus]